MIGPAFVGAGTPAFEGPTRMPVELLDSRTVDGSQLVLTRYGARDQGS